MANRSNKKNVTIQQVLTALLDREKVFPPAYLRRLSDLEGRDLQALESIWPQVIPSRRLSVLEDLEDLAEADTLVSFEAVGRMSLTDEDPRVRAVAIRLMWEDENQNLVPIFIRMLNDDPDPAVRAAAATALGQFVYLGELEKIPENLLRDVEENLLSVISSPEEALIRRRALESMGYSGRKEMAGLIREAYNTNDPDWMSSALFAMGRSADSAWAPDVVRMLRHPKVNVQLEAVRAAGNLEIETARRALLDLLEEEAQDSEVRAATIWSLSQIGGEEVRETLEQILDETEDEEEAELVENALDNLTFTEDVGMFGMFDFANRPEEDGYEDVETYLAALEEDDDEDNPKGHNKDAKSGPDEDQKRHRH